jgi:hypothetical protein
MLIMLLLWMIGIYSMYLSSHFTMLKRGNEQVIGEHKAVLKLANAMRAQIGHESTSCDLLVLTEKEGLNGGSISFKTTVPFDNTGYTGNSCLGNTHPPLRLGNWLKKEKWWLLVTVLWSMVVIVVVAGVLPNLPLPLLPFELPFIVYVGQSGGSRAVLSFWMLWWFCARGLMPFMYTIAATHEMTLTGFLVG